MKKTLAQYAVSSYKNMALPSYALRTVLNHSNGLMSKRKLDRYRDSVDFVTQRLSLIRSLYIVCVAASGPRELIDKEFREAVGDVMEGMAIHQLTLTYIDEEKVRAEAAWLREKA